MYLHFISFSGIKTVQVWLNTLISNGIPPSSWKATHQEIAWTDSNLLSIGLLGTIFNEIRINTQAFSLTIMTNAICKIPLLCLKKPWIVLICRHVVEWMMSDLFYNFSAVLEVYLAGSWLFLTYPSPVGEPISTTMTDIVVRLGIRWLQSVELEKEEGMRSVFVHHWKPRDVIMSIDLIHKSQNAHVPYPTILHSEQKCAHFCSEWSIVGDGTDAFWDLWIRSFCHDWCHNNTIRCYPLG